MFLKIENHKKIKNDQILDNIYKNALQFFSPVSINIEEFKILLAILFSKISLNIQSNNLIKQRFLDLNKKYSFLNQRDY